jgi:hypothetical protein
VLRIRAPKAAGKERPPPAKGGSERGSSSQAVELRPVEAMRRDLPPSPPAASTELKREEGVAAGLGGSLNFSSVVMRVAMEANLRTWMLSSKR